MKLGIGLKVANSLSLTPQLQQAIKLLQLSALELEQEIQTHLDNNPLLEKIEESEYTVLAAETDTHAPDEPFQHIPTELPIDTQWDEIYNHQPTALATPEYDDEREDNRSYSESLQEHIRWQINLLHLSATDRLIAEYIVDALDERGYLQADVSEIAEAVNALLTRFDRPSDDSHDEIDSAEVTAVLKAIQHLDPLGIAARDLTECLRLQLEQLAHHPAQPLAQSLLNHRELLLGHDLAKLVKITQMTMEQLTQAMTLLKSLDPAPGTKFQSNTQHYQIPDVILNKKNDRWHVFLNPDVLPRLRINSYYSSMIKRADNSTDNQYLKNQLHDAKSLIKSIDERHKSLLKVASCIVAHQRDFFDIGPEAMKPLILKDIADEVELHESTVSRITTNKYVLTPRGLFELKYFFSSHVATANGGECSSTAIRARIKKLIQSENPKKPYSDNTLTKMLQDEGIDVARRTVAKYRESLNIPSSSERKVLF